MISLRNRKDAGRQLAQGLEAFALERPVVLGLPRGGVVVAAEVALALRAPLDVWVVRKVGVPWQPELALGAVAEGGALHVNWGLLAELGLSDEALATAIDGARREVEAAVARLRGARGRPALEGRTVVLVDDGIATGATVHAAVESVRAEGARRVVVAAPVASPRALEVLEPEVDALVALFAPDDFRAVGRWYDEFDEVTDDEVVRLLEAARTPRAPAQVHV